MNKERVFSIFCSVVLACTMMVIPVFANEPDAGNDQNGSDNQVIENATEQNITNEEESTQREPDITVTAGETMAIEVGSSITEVRSNDQEIATVFYDEEDGTYKVKGEKIGTTEIIYVDDYNKETVLSLRVEKPPFQLSRKELKIDCSYNTYYYWNSHEEVWEYDEYGDEVYKTIYDYEPLYWIRNSDDSSGEEDSYEYYDSYDSYYGDYPVYSGNGIQIEPTTRNNIVSVKSSNTNVVRISANGIHRFYEWNDDNEDYEEFYLEDCYDIHPVGVGTAIITCTGEYGETATVKVTVTKKFMSSLIQKKSSLPNLKYGNKTLSGKAPVGATVSVKIGKKKYKVKANSKGKFYIKKIPNYKIGTKVYYCVSYKGGSYSAKKKIVKPGTTISFSRVYRKTKTVKVTLKNVRKGEVFRLKIGKKTYTKKITKTAKKYTFKVKVKKKKKAGSKIKATVTNRYKQNVSTKSGVVYYASKIKKGMTKSQCKLVPGWGSPDEVYVSGKYTTWWYDDDGDGYAIDSALRFKKGKLIGWYY